MSNFRILYPNEGGVSVIVPALGVTQEQVMKDVPTGKPYLVVDVSDIPTDRTFRNAWEVDFTDAQVKA